MSGINLSDLPPKYQAQIAAKLADQARHKLERDQIREKRSRSKYGNVPTTRHEIKFPSQKEARRYDELVGLQRAGVISDLRLQVEFTLQPAYTTPEGERIRAIRYLADFTYIRDGVEIIEDVKSRPTRTQQYRMKAKMMQDRLGLKITEV